ncbi:MAG: TlpA family protein disulfide reductase [Agriterribacter sp.]
MNLQHFSMSLCAILISCSTSPGSAKTAKTTSPQTDSVIVSYFAVKKGSFTPFTYFDRYGTFKQFDFEKIEKDSLYKKTIISKLPIQFYYSYKKKVPLWISPGDTVTITIRGDSISVKSLKIKHDAGNFFPSLNNTGSSIFSYKQNSQKKTLPERNIYLEKLFDSSIQYLATYRQDLYDKVYNTYYHIIIYEYLRYKLARLAVDKSPGLQVFLDSIKPFTQKEEYSYLNEQRFFLNTYGNVKWGTNFKDPRQFIEHYDSAAIFYQGKIKDKQLFYCLRSIRNKAPKFLDEYIAKFYKDCGDSSLIKYVKENYDKQLSELQSDLVDINKKAIGWDKLLKDNAGKLIYIDFWASWCAPCRREMPYAQKIRDSYSGKPFTYVYISIDDVFSDWLEAVREESLENYIQNYKTSKASSTLHRLFDLSSIPRYVLINKDGTLIDANALRPTDSKLTELIDRYL